MNRALNEQLVLPRSATYTPRELFAWGRRALQAVNLEGAHADQDARELLEWVLGCDSLVSAPDQVGARAAERYRCAIASRRTSIPLQHITGRMYFRMLTLRAEPGVFVVRPETEMVAQHAIDAARTCSADEPVVVDLCTGSGAIALAVATEVPASRVLAVEIDEAACQLAARNIADIEPVRVHLVRADALSALVEYEGRADVVVSNPPYVPGSAHPTQREAQLDPPRALYGGGEDGLVIPRSIMTRARALLAPGGTLVMEHAESQAEDLVAYATAQGFTNAHTAPDLTGRPRMVIATAPVVEQ